MVYVSNTYTLKCKSKLTHMKQSISGSMVGGELSSMIRKIRIDTMKLNEALLYKDDLSILLYLAKYSPKSNTLPLIDITEKFDGSLKLMEEVGLIQLSIDNKVKLTDYGIFQLYWLMKDAKIMD